MHMSRKKMFFEEINLWLDFCDTLQVSPDTDSLISNGYHNNLKMSQSCDFLPKAQPEAISFWLHISYFLQKCKKGKPDEMDLPLMENDITTFELASGIANNSSNLQLSSGCDIVLWYHRKIRLLIFAGYCRYHQH